MRADVSFPEFCPFGLGFALRSAVLARGVGRAREAADRLDELPYSDRFTEAIRTWARAVVAALEERYDEAAMGFRDALANLREMHQDFDLARAGLDMALLLGPEHPDVAAF